MSLLKGIALAAVAALVAQAQSKWTWQGCADITPADIKKEALVSRNANDPNKVEGLTALHGDLKEPLKSVLAPDGRLFIVERDGDLKIWKNGSVITAGSLSVFSKHPMSTLPGLTGSQRNGEMGLHGIALDPAFATNGWIYLHYAPAVDSVWHVSRFTMNGDVLDKASEKILLTVPAQRRKCCHTGGDMMFDGEGNLWISMGNNTMNPVDRAVDGYVKESDPDADDQGHSANTNDFRGKILRIKPTADGKYTIPPGNLYPPGTDSTKPEIYAMGMRNAYTIYYDRYTGWLTWGDIGPDGEREPGTENGAKYEEINLFKKPGNAGWPYFAGQADYAGYKYKLNKDPAAPMNLSRNNTGKKRLPPAQGAILGYEQGAAITGPIYHYDGKNTSARKLPPHFNKLWFYSDFNGNHITLAQLDAAGDRIVGKQVLTDNNLRKVVQPLHLHLGHDGALYVVEYGGAYFANTIDTRISRFVYEGACRPNEPSPTSIHDAARVREGGLLAGVNLAHRRMIDLPRGARGFRLYDIRGRIAWEYAHRGSEAAQVAVPADLGAGVLRIQYLR